MRGSSATSGRLWPSSHFDTAAFVTPRRSASWACVTPAVRRSRAMVAPIPTSFMVAFLSFGSRPLWDLPAPGSGTLSALPV